MAVTSIWPIKGRVDTVINYARNPEKTRESSHAAMSKFHEIKGVIEYAADDIKTETREYVSCLNLTSEELAAKEFMETKLLKGKTGGRVCYHGYQSFKADEVDAATAHAIGYQLAQNLWGDRFQVVIATHCNTGHYHNHFVINSVSDTDGLKFYNSPADYRAMREESDRLCREFGISVIEHPNGRGKNYSEWQADKNGNPTVRGLIRADIDRAIRASTTEKHFVDTMRAMGYEFKTRGSSGERLAHPTLKPPGAKGYFRFYKLGPGYDLDEIIERIYENSKREVPFPDFDEDVRKKYPAEKLPHTKLTGLHALYVRYCFELHIIKEHPTSMKRVHFLLREDLMKLDRLDSQTRFLGENKITTISELKAKLEGVRSKIAELTAERKDLRNQLKRAKRSGNEQLIAQIEARVSEISTELRELRKEAAICNAIEERSGQVQSNLEQLTQEQESERKEQEQYELFRRSGRSGRSDVTERR